MNEDDIELAAAVMENGMRAGLQTADMIQLAAEAKKKRDQREATRNQEKSSKDEETIYRDATGRRMDIALHRAELRRQIQEKEKEEQREIELGKGLTQQRQKEERRRELEQGRKHGFTRTRDDEELNAEQRSQIRWNDPAASFMTSEELTKTGEELDGGKNKSKVKKKRPMYKGAAPSNRFGILPGYRWDGVDRSNGYEKSLFKRLNEQKARKQAHHAWSTEDM